jgi:hypothetical protein
VQLEGNGTNVLREQDRTSQMSWNTLQECKQGTELLSRWRKGRGDSGSSSENDRAAAIRLEGGLMA